MTTEVLLDELLVAIAVKVSTPKEISRMARACSQWYAILEAHRTQIIAEALQVTPWARCGGTTSLGEALGVWQEHIRTSPFIVVDQCLRSPGQCVSALETQLALFDEPAVEGYLAPFDAMTPPSNPRTTSNRYYKAMASPRLCLNLAVGLVAHVALFNNVFHTGLTVMWSRCKGLHKDAYGDLIFHLLAAPDDVVLPMDVIVATFSPLADKLAKKNSSWIDHILASTLGRIFIHEETAYLAQFLGRFVQFWCHPALSSHWKAYCLSLSNPLRNYHILDVIVTKFWIWYPAHSTAILQSAWEACYNALFTGVRFNLIDGLPNLFLIQVMADNQGFLIASNEKCTIKVIKEYF
jgi:hypothetical protein